MPLRHAIIFAPLPLSRRYTPCCFFFDTLIIDTMIRYAIAALLPPPYAIIADILPFAAAIRRHCAAAVNHTLRHAFATPRPPPRCCCRLSIMHSHAAAAYYLRRAAIYCDAVALDMR